MFICNHCPYVKAVRDRIVRDTRELLEYGVNSVAIMSNDPTDYPEDSFDSMIVAAERFGFPSLISSTLPRKSPKPMERCAPRISSAITNNSNSSIGAGSTKAARSPHR